MYAAGPAGPGQRRNPVGGRDPRDPLKRHQNREHMVGALTNILLMLVEDFRDPPRGRFINISVWVSHLLAFDIQIPDRTGDIQRQRSPFVQRFRCLRTTQLRFDLRYRRNGRAKL